MTPEQLAEIKSRYWYYPFQQELLDEIDALARQLDDANRHIGKLENSKMYAPSFAVIKLMDQIAELQATNETWEEWGASIVKAVEGLPISGEPRGLGWATYYSVPDQIKQLREQLQAEKERADSNFRIELAGRERLIELERQLEAIEVEARRTPSYSELERKLAEVSAAVETVACAVEGQDYVSDSWISDTLRKALAKGQEA